MWLTAHKESLTSQLLEKNNILQNIRMTHTIYN